MTQSSITNEYIEIRMWGEIEKTEREKGNEEQFLIYSLRFKG